MAFEFEDGTAFVESAWLKVGHYADYADGWLHVGK